MRRTWAVVLVALACVTGCADVEPSASTGAYDDEADSHAAERAKVVHADAGQPSAETPDSAPTAPDAGTPAVEPAITAAAPDANVAQPTAPDAGSIVTTSPSAPDADASVVQPSNRALTDLQAAYDDRAITVSDGAGVFNLRLTIHVGAAPGGKRDSIAVFDVKTKTAQPSGSGLLGVEGPTTWYGGNDDWRFSIRFSADGQTVIHIDAQQLTKGGLIFDNDTNGDWLNVGWAH